MTLTVDQVVWTVGVEEAIQAKQAGDADGVRKFLEFSLKQLERSVVLVRGKLTKLERQCMGSLIVIDVHARSVVEDLIASDVSAIIDFDWAKQLRYYWVADRDTWMGKFGQCVARQTNTKCAPARDRPARPLAVLSAFGFPGHRRDAVYPPGLGLPGTITATSTSATSRAW